MKHEIKYLVVASVKRCYISATASLQVDDNLLSVTASCEDSIFSSYTLHAEVTTETRNYFLIRVGEQWELGMCDGDNSNLLSCIFFASTPKGAIQELFRRAVNAEMFSELLIESAIKKLVEFDDEYVEYWVEGEKSLRMWCKEHSIVLNEAS